MNLNLTSIGEIKTIEELVVQCHNATAVPSLVFGALSYFLILIGGLFAFSDDKQRFFIFWLIGFLVLGGIFLFLSLSPLWVYEFGTKLLNFWK